MHSSTFSWLADDFTVERAVNLSQQDSWADISKFQWQEIDHGIQDDLGFYLFHPKKHVLPSYVAWIAVSDVPNNARVIEFDESETTGIDLTTAPSQREGAVYDLQGRKIESGKLSNGQLPKGLYVMNGKLVIIR